MPRYQDYVRVTPRIAREWLSRNADNNRNPKTGKIPGYARDMAADRWRNDTGEAIKFDPEGNLIDGQNRLMAVLEADKDPSFKGYVEFTVAYDVPREAMRVLDSGAARTFADRIKVRSKDRMRSSSIVRWVESWDAGYPMNAGGTKASRTDSELDQAFEREPMLFESAAQRAGDCYRQGLGAVGPVGTAYVLFHRIDPEACKAFFDAVISGANLPENHPALALRKRMGRAKLDRITRPEVLALYVRAWNWYRKDEAPKHGKLQISRGDLTNATFPRPL